MEIKVEEIAISILYEKYVLVYIERYTALKKVILTS